MCRLSCLVCHVPLNRSGISVCDAATPSGVKIAGALPPRGLRLRLALRAAAGQREDVLRYRP